MTDKRAILDLIIGTAYAIADERIKENCVTLDGRHVRLHEDQIKFVRAVLDPECNRSILSIGSAGTGKSAAIKVVSSAIRAAARRCAFLFGDRCQLTRDVCNLVAVEVAAPTGVAAINIGGSTAHSMFNIPVQSQAVLNDTPHSYIYTMGEKQLTDKVFYSNCHPDKLRSWECVVIVIIDEFTMLDKASFRWINIFLGLFGTNARLVLLGDPLQLPPIDVRVKGSNCIAQFPFQTAAFAEINPKVVVFHEHNGRRFQEDPVLKELAANIRSQMPHKVMQSTHMSSIKFVNEMLYYDGVPDDWGYNYTTICFRNLDQDSINTSTRARVLSETPELVQYRFNVSLWSPERCDGRKKGCNYSTQEAELLNRFKPIALFIGARVMLLHNISVAQGLCNGMIGTVVGFIFAGIRARGPVGVTVETITRNGRELHEIHITDVVTCHEKLVLAGINCMPLCLAWALTVHKMQGQTLQGRIRIFGSPWGAGQLYVALTRAPMLVANDENRSRCVVVSQRLSQKQFAMNDVARMFVDACIESEETGEDIISAMCRLMPPSDVQQLVSHLARLGKTE